MRILSAFAPACTPSLAEQTAFSFPLLQPILSYYAEGCTASCMRDRMIRYFPPAERTAFPQAAPLGRDTGATAPPAGSEVCFCASFLAQTMCPLTIILN
jgi:hypothetical protein